MNRTSKKLLSVILVIAICVSTVCSAVIGAYAATVGSTYSIVSDSVAAGTKKTTVTVTLTNPNGLTNGTFDLMFGKEVIDDVNFDENGNYVTPKNETYDEFMARDTDGNFMISAVNFYKQITEQVPVYDEEGNVISYDTVTKTVVDEEKSYKENSGNKGVLLPNVYDGAVGLYDTKIEITGGTKVGGGEFDIKDFVNNNYETFAKGEGNTTNAIYKNDTAEDADKSLVVDDDNDGRKYIYNMTDGYKKTHYSSTPITYVDVVQDGETVRKAIPDNNLLEKYYREYTTVDVATENLGYKISTVSEDTIGSTHMYAQYAQGFKDITFSSDVAYESITFTVTFDYSGTSDRISANNGVTLDQLTGEATDSEGNPVSYREDDGHWATENYIQYGKKYALNFVTSDAALSGLSAESENVNTNFFHTHEGTIDTKQGTVAPVNQAAIDELLAKNPNAKAGVDYFEIYNATCDICRRVTPMIAASNLPYNASGAYKYNNYRNISGLNVVYEDDGSLSLNIHYPSAMDGEQMFITDQNGMIMEYSDILENNDDVTSKYTATKSIYASVKDENVSIFHGDILTTSQMITIKGFSASDLDKTLYIARYTPKSSTETQLMGVTHAISLSDYLNEIIYGDYEDKDKLLAVALLNYSNSSKTALANKTPVVDKIVPTKIDLLEFSDDLIANGSTSKYYDSVLADNGETGADWDNAIIIDSAEEFVYLAKASGNDTDGKYYKVADDILAFDLSSGNLDFDGTLEENLSKIQGSGKNHSGGTPGFQGYFDGNGVTVYGAWGNNKSVSAYSGLFTCAKGDVLIKNVHVKLASFTGQQAVGGIVAYYEGEGNYTNNTTLTIENCSVTDSHLEVTATGYNYGLGAMVGLVKCPSSYVDKNDEDGDKDTTDTVYVNNKVIINNCYVNLDEEYFITVNEGASEAGHQVCHGGVIGVCGSNAAMVSNSVVVGITPYATSISNDQNAVQHSGLENHFTNVYTTDDVAITGVYLGGSLTNRNFTNKVFPLTTAKMTGEAAKNNMSKLDWDTTWYVSDDGSIGIYAPYNIPEVTGKVVYWDGTVATGIATGDGSKTNPYVIKTAAEFAWLIKQNETVSADKYFEIDEAIDKIVLQPKDKVDAILALSDAKAVKTYFESASGLKSWPNISWEGSSFCGHFDGNGVTIYGLYQKSSNNAGLFSTVDAGAVIKNVTLKNSYLTSTASNYQVGGIVAVTNSSDYGRKNSGIIWIDGCTVANNYMYNHATDGADGRSGVIVGAAQNDSVYIDNCLVYGNDATYVNGIMTICSIAKNNVEVNGNAIVPEGLVTVNDGDVSKPLYYNMVRNTVILGALPYDLTQEAGARFNDARCYQNVYSDAPNGKVVFNDGSSFTLSENQIKQIAVEDILGNKAKNVMPTLDWYHASANPNGKWYASELNAMPSLSPLNENILESVSNQIPVVKDIYESIIFDDPDTREGNEVYHENGSMTFGVYQTALSLKAEPYMSFAFAFYGDYQQNRNKIQIRFTYTANGEETTYDITPPEYTGEEIKNVNGWTNTKANGRYHTYKASDLPIEAMLNGITVEMNYNNEGWKSYGTFDIEGVGYQFEQLNASSPSEYYETRIEAAKALVLYIKARALCFGA